MILLLGELGVAHYLIITFVHSSIQSTRIVGNGATLFRIQSNKLDLILGLIESCAMFCRFDSCVTQDCYLRCFVHAAAQNADMFIALWASLNEGVFKDHS